MQSVVAGIFLALALSWLVVSSVHAQAMAGDLLVRINHARLNQGLPPYVISPELSAAAQRHSNDMAATGQIDHTGSDGSSSTQRVLEAGYGVFDFGPVTSENVYGGTGGAEAPFDVWMSQSGARSNLLSEKYREVGIGVANDDQGRIFWTLDVGAQPNILPVLIDDGATSLESVTVTLTLVRENVVPQGQGTAMGQPVAFRASTNPRFPDAEWRPWAERVTFVFEEKTGRQTVYVQLRDAADRTTVAQASATLANPDQALTPTLTTETKTPETPTVTGTATVRPTRTPLPSATPSRAATGTPTATTIAPTMPTLTPRGTETAQPTITPAPTGTPIPSETPSSVPVFTPTLTLSRAPTSTLQAITGTPMSTGSSTGREESKEQLNDRSSAASRLAPWAVGLQIVALILGVYLALRRSDSELETDIGASGVEREP